MTVCVGFHGFKLDMLMKNQEWGQKFSEEALEKSKDKTVLKRFATVEDVADQVKTLALSRSMTGVNVVIDSGFVL